MRALLARQAPELAAQMEAGGGISGNRTLTLRQMLAMRPALKALSTDIAVALAQLESSP